MSSLALGSFIAADTNFTGNVTEHPVKYTRKHLANITKHFVHYYSYFGHQPGSFGGIACYQCPVPKFQNETERMIASALKSSVNRNFSPRILSRDQVSWRAKGEKNKVKPSSTTAGNTTLTGDGNNGTSTVANVDVDEAPPARNDTIHNHLVFALLLPHHPFSQDVRRALTTVAPMYPQMTVVLGSAYDFKDMSSKYFVTSFPKILYFKAGIYVENYAGDYDVVQLAAQMAEWANALPSAIPIPFKDTKLAATTPAGVRDFDIYAPGAQMRHGLSLQQLPRTAQYPVVDVMLPLWALDVVPYLQYLNNSAFIERRARVATTALPASPATPAPAVASTASEGNTNATQDSEKTSQGAVPTASEAAVCADGTAVDSTGTCPARPVHTASSSEAPPNAAQSPAGHEGSDAQTSGDEAEKSGVQGLRDAVNPTVATVPLVVTITVPFPNMEPFLGSIENYAVWDTRVFLLAGLYTIVRVLYLIRKYAFGTGAAAPGAPAGGGNQ
jgi:hypothetical protein